MFLQRCNRHLAILNFFTENCPISGYVIKTPKTSPKVAILGYDNLLRQETLHGWKVVFAMTSSLGGKLILKIDQKYQEN